MLGLVKRSHGGLVNLPCNRKGQNGNPSPIGRRARGLSQHCLLVSRESSSMGQSANRLFASAPSWDLTGLRSPPWSKGKTSQLAGRASICLKQSCPQSRRKGQREHSRIRKRSRTGNPSIPLAPAATSTIVGCFVSGQVTSLDPRPRERRLMPRIP